MSKIIRILKCWFGYHELHTYQRIEGTFFDTITYEGCKHCPYEKRIRRQWMGLDC